MTPDSLSPGSMSPQTAALIERLAAEAAPVTPLPPPGRRAASWLACFAVLAAALIALAGRPEDVMGRLDQPWFGVALLAAGLTGAGAVLSAFHLAIPGHHPGWGRAPLVPLAVWLGASGWGCWQDWVTSGPDGIAPGHTGECFAFIAGFGVVIAMGLVPMLRAARPLAPRHVAVHAGLGVAGLAAFLLAFFHPFDITFLDLGVHALAVGVVIGAMTLSARRTLNA